MTNVHYPRTHQPEGAKPDFTALGSTCDPRYLINIFYLHLYTNETKPNWRLKALNIFADFDVTLESFFFFFRPNRRICFAHDESWKKIHV